MATVDTEIDNTIRRAAAWGSFVDIQANLAVEGIDVFPGIASPTQAPEVFTADLGEPDFPSIDDADAFGSALEVELKKFFEDYFSADDAYQAASNWVLSALTSGDPTVPTQFNAAIFGDDGSVWAKARLHTNAIGNDLDGIDLPSAITHEVDIDAIDYAQEHMQTKVKSELWSHAASLRIRDIRTEAIMATGDYIKALSRVNISALNGKTSLLAEKQRAEQATADWYAALLTPATREYDRERIAISEGRTFEISKAGAKHAALEQSVDAMIKAADGLGKVAQAANASMNSIVSASQTGF